MAQKSANKNRSASPDWFVRGVLTKLGDTFDRFTGRGWKPSSSLATSELSEKLKALVDSEARETPDKRLFVPHHIKLKIQWDKFATDSEAGLKKLETELMTALVDHINDRRYYTYGPISLEVKPDYFTNGVKLSAGFESSDRDEDERALNVTVPSLKVEEVLQKVEPTRYAMRIRLSFAAAAGKISKEMEMRSGGRISIGRTKENDLAIDDPSVSKMHAALLLNTEGSLVVADTGSTNGTFVNNERIAYGKAIALEDGTKLRFGSVDVELDMLQRNIFSEPQEEVVTPPAEKDDSYQVGDLQFTSKISHNNADEPAATVPSVQLDEIAAEKDVLHEPAPTEASIPVKADDLNGTNNK